MNKNVKRSQKHNREAGLWQGLAPIGYLNAKDERRKSTLILDPERAPIIKQIFEEYASGVHSLKSVWLSATEKGLISKEPNYNTRSKNYGKYCPVSRNKIHDILTNPFYYGAMYVADEEIDERTKKPVKTFYKLINHVYEPLISKELFDKVQKVLKTRKKERFCKEQKYAGIPFVFRGLITCKCGCAITPEHHKKGNKEYVYLRCSHQKGTCNQKLVNENTILEQLEKEIFHQIRISPTMHDLLKTSIIQTLEDEKKINASVRKKIAEEITLIDNWLEKLWEKQQRREWFLEHFDKIWENRHKFKLGTPYASVIVDGIIITSFACPYYGYVVDKISIGNLIKLWDNSFMFRGYPLIHYRRHHNSDYSSISYIKDRKVISYDYSYWQPPEEQYIPTRLVLQILKNLRRYQPDDLDNYRTVEELAEELF